MCVCIYIYMLDVKVLELPNLPGKSLILYILYIYIYIIYNYIIIYIYKYIYISWM